MDHGGFLLPVPCDGCGLPIHPEDAHLPHHPGCDRHGCTCDLWLCLDCCPECKPGKADP